MAYDKITLKTQDILKCFEVMFMSIYYTYTLLSHVLTSQPHGL